VLRGRRPVEPERWRVRLALRDATWRDRSSMRWSKMALSASSEGSVMLQLDQYSCLSDHVGVTNVGMYVSHRIRITPRERLWGPEKGLLSER
jgi:hypothetical protein